MDVCFSEQEVPTEVGGLGDAHFFASDSSYLIFTSQGRFCQGRAKRGLTVPLTGSSLRSILPLRMNHSEAIYGGGGFIAKRLVRAFIVIKIDKIVNLFPCLSWTLVIF